MSHSTPRILKIILVKNRSKYVIRIHILAKKKQSSRKKFVLSPSTCQKSSLQKCVKHLSRRTIQLLTRLTIHLLPRLTIHLLTQLTIHLLTRQTINLLP